MDLRFSTAAWEDYVYWQTTDRNVARRLNAVITDMRRSPFEGIGKPEPLKESVSGWWSRRITGEHRIVYRVAGDRQGEQTLDIASCRYHYG